VRDADAVAIDLVVEAEARSAQVAAAHPDVEDVVEDGGALVLEVDAGRQCLEPALADRTVAAGERGEIRDAGHLEPDDERRVVRDPLRVCLREADAHLVGERVAVHRTEIYRAVRCGAWGPRPISRR
jgi:hypothetical protein